MDNRREMSATGDFLKAWKRRKNSWNSSGQCDFKGVVLMGSAKYTQTHHQSLCVCVVSVMHCSGIDCLSKKTGIPKTYTGREPQCHGPREIAHIYKPPACRGWKKYVLPALPGIKSTLLPPHIITTCKDTLSSTRKEMKVISLIIVRNPNIVCI